MNITIKKQGTNEIILNKKIASSIIPRIGEALFFENSILRIQDVLYHFEENSITIDKITIIAEQYIPEKK